MRLQRGKGGGGCREGKREEDSVEGKEIERMQGVVKVVRGEEEERRQE